MFTPGFIFFKPKPTELIVGLRLSNSWVILKQNPLILVNRLGNRNNYIRTDDMNYRKLFAQGVNIIQPQVNTLKLFSLRKNISFDNCQNLLCFFDGALHQLGYHQSSQNLKTKKNLISYLHLSFSSITSIQSVSQKGLVEQKVQQISFISGNRSRYVLLEISYFLLGIYSQIAEIPHTQQGKIDDTRSSINLIAPIASQSIQVEKNRGSQQFSSTINKADRNDGTKRLIYSDCCENIATHLISRTNKSGIIPSFNLNKINGTSYEIKRQSQYFLRGISAQYSDFESKVKLLTSLIGDLASYNISCIPNISIEISVLRFLQNSHCHQFITSFGSTASLSTTGVIQLSSSRLTRANIEIPLNKAINLGGQTSTLYPTTYDLISKNLSESSTIRQTEQLAITINHGNNRQYFSRQPHCLIQHCGIGSEIILLHTVSIDNLTTQAYQITAQSQIVVNRTISEPIFLSQASVTLLFLDLTQTRIMYFPVDTQINQDRAIQNAIPTQEIRGIINQVGKINNPFFTLNSKIEIAHLSEQKIENIKIALTETTNGQANQLTLVEIASWDGVTTQLWDNIEESIWNVLS
ncbi:MAG: hypothetical protein ACRCT1_15460 [Microcoleaceae cyanobacterium]